MHGPITFSCMYNIATGEVKNECFVIISVGRYCTFYNLDIRIFDYTYLDILYKFNQRLNKANLKVITL